MVILLYFALLLLWTLLIVLVEGVILTLLHWSSFYQSLVATLIANLASTLITVILLMLVKQPSYISVLVGWIISSIHSQKIILEGSYEFHRKKRKEILADVYKMEKKKV